MSRYFSDSRHFPNYDRVIGIAAVVFHVTRDAILGRDRHSDIARARHVAMYICYRYTRQASYPTIAHSFGNRDHTTVLSAVDRIGSQLGDDPLLAKQVEAMRAIVARESFYAVDERAASGVSRKDEHP